MDQSIQSPSTSSALSDSELSITPSSGCESSPGTPGENKDEKLNDFFISTIDLYLETSKTSKAMKQLIRDDKNTWQLLSDWQNLDDERKKIVSRVFWSEPCTQYLATKQDRKQLEAENIQCLKKNNFIQDAEPNDRTSTSWIFMFLKKNLEIGVMGHDDWPKKALILSFLARNTFYEILFLMHLGDLGLQNPENPQKNKGSNPKFRLKPEVNMKSYLKNLNGVIMANASMVFRNRKEFYNYLKGCLLYKTYKTMNNKEKLINIDKIRQFFIPLNEDGLLLHYMTLPPWLRRFTPAYISVVILEDAIKIAKKEKEYKCALNFLETLISQTIFRQHLRALWFTEKAFILQNYLKQYEKAGTVLLTALKEGFSDDAKQYLRDRGSQILNNINDLSHEMERKLRKHSQLLLLACDLPSNTLYGHKVKNEWYAMQGYELEEHVQTIILSCERKYKDDFNIEEVKAAVIGITKPMTFKDANLIAFENIKQIIIKIPSAAVSDKKEILMKLKEAEQCGKLLKVLKLTSGLSSEQFCIDKYCKTLPVPKFSHGRKVEGRIMTTMFDLLFWDIIYAKPKYVVGIFFNQYQQPLDMYSESFYINRQALIEDKLGKITNNQIEDTVKLIQDKWVKLEEYGQKTKIEWQDLEDVAYCLGGPLLAVIFRRFAQNYGYTYWGFPDLTLWNRDTRQIKFVEVKAEKDTLSIRQLQWLHYLQDHGVDTEICYLKDLYETMK